MKIDYTYKRAPSHYIAESPFKFKYFKQSLNRNSEVSIPSKCCVTSLFIKCDFVVYFAKHIK